MATSFNPFFRYTDLNGAILENGRLRFLDPATDDLKAIYTDYTGSTPKTNPVALDSEGMVADNGVWLGSGYYKVQVQSYGGLDGLGDPIYNTEYEIDYLGSAVSAGAVSGNLTVVSTMAALRAIPSASAPDQVYMMGYLSAYDGGGGFFNWASANVSSDDGGAVVALDDSPSIGRYLRANFDRADVRFWGAIPGVAVQMNGMITNAANYCANNDMELYFPSGKYQVTGGSLYVYSKLTIDNGAEFKNTSGVSSYVIYLYNEQGTGWNLPRKNLKSNDSTGMVYPDFTYAKTWQGPQDVYADLYEDFIRLCEHIGNQRAVFTQVWQGGDIGNNSYTLPHAYFKDNGAITFSATGTGTASFTLVECGQLDAVPIIQGTLPYLYFGCDLRATWLGADITRKALRYWGIGGNLILDLDLDLDDDLEPNTWNSRVIATRDNKATVTGRALTLTQWVDGSSWIHFGAGGYVIADKIPNASNFDLTTDFGIQGYIKSCSVAGQVADFGGISYDGDIDLSGISSSIIKGLTVNGSVYADNSTSHKFIECTVNAPTTAFSGAFIVSMVDCTLSLNTSITAALFVLSSFTAKDCTIVSNSSGISTAGALDLSNCYISGLIVEAKGSNVNDCDWFTGNLKIVANDSGFLNANVKNNVFQSVANTLIGGTSIGRVIIEENDYSVLADPISVSGCTATSITGVYSVRNNTPRINTLDSLPSVVVRTTEMDFYKLVNFAGFASSGGNYYSNGTISADPSTATWSAKLPSVSASNRLLASVALAAELVTIGNAAIGGSTITIQAWKGNNTTVNLGISFRGSMY